ncbi:hypothetical protein KQL69_001983 [Escherichia coli]|nr:hypothetical protein [Escherichia coli]EHP9644738.1 hypothetical protein [Escherichia coli]EHP9683122.1 hypothetical protein [Escherichia coli]EHP9688374.1 hypothetical protein [Escherichia coli]EHP9718028.1 hypothetical protein [Escherichia coli]
MSQYLIFQLHGPMASWGVDPAKGIIQQAAIPVITDIVEFMKFNLYTFLYTFIRRLMAYSGKYLPEFFRLITLPPDTSVYPMCGKHLIQQTRLSVFWSFMAFLAPW